MVAAASMAVFRHKSADQHRKIKDELPMLWIFVDYYKYYQITSLEDFKIKSSMQNFCFHTTFTYAISSRTNRRWRYGRKVVVNFRQLQGNFINKEFSSA